MSRRIEQVNELLKEKLGSLISREIPLEEGMITITYVKVSPDLKYAKIGVSVLPDNLTGTALKRLRSSSGLFAGVLRKEIKMRTVPKFNWVFDDTEKEAAKIDKLFDEINSEDE